MNSGRNTLADLDKDFVAYVKEDRDLLGDHLYLWKSVNGYYFIENRSSRHLYVLQKFNDGQIKMVNNSRDAEHLWMVHCYD